MPLGPIRCHLDERERPQSAQYCRQPLAGELAETSATGNAMLGVLMDERKQGHRVVVVLYTSLARRRPRSRPWRLKARNRYLGAVFRARLL